VPTGGLDDLEGETDVREEKDVRELVEKSELRSEAEVVVVVDWTDVRAEGGRERGGAGGGGEVMGSGGGTRRVLVLVREGAELLAEGVSARIGEVVEDGEEPREARLLVPEPRCWDGGRWGSLGGSGGGGGFEVAAAVGGFWGRGGSVMGGRNDEGADTFSNDSSRLSPSSLLATVHSRSMENACRGLIGTAVGSPLSEERETEWKDETEEACAWP
jgi:hypothetical protein